MSLYSTTITFCLVYIREVFFGGAHPLCMDPLLFIPWYMHFNPWFTIKFFLIIYVAVSFVKWSLLVLFWYSFFYDKHSCPVHLIGVIMGFRCDVTLFLLLELRNASQQQVLRGQVKMYGLFSLCKTPLRLLCSNSRPSLGNFFFIVVIGVNQTIFSIRFNIFSY